MTKQGNFRVIVIPDKPRFGITEGNWKTRCSDIIMAIERHIDDVQTLYRESDTLCGFCNSKWETETSKNDPHIPYGQPLCCEEAVKEWEATQRKEAKKNDASERSQ